MINNVLIIEDDKDMQDLVVSFLTLYGLKENRILLASDPIEGLEIFRNRKDEISLVICDYYMPKSNGAELCEILKKNQSHTPIILQTGDLNIQLKDIKFVDSVLHKPYKYESLVSVMEDLCAKPPIFDFKEQEIRISNIDNMGMSVKFLLSKRNGHGLVLDKSDSGYKIAMKPSADIMENAIIETRATAFNFDDNSSTVNEMKKFEIVWFQLLSLDVCIVGLKLI